MRRLSIAVFAIAAFLAVNPAQAQTAQTTPPAENMTAARELIQASHATDQFKAILPTLIQGLKTAVVQNRPEIEKQYDAMMPIFSQKAQQRLGELTDVIATIYANNFTVDELHQITAFYQSEAGQKYLSRQQAILQQSMAAGRQFGQEVAKDVQEEMSGHAN